MDINIPLEEMTIAEKLRALDAIWADLTRTPESVPSPAWHQDVLRARADRLGRGMSAYSDWEEAKERIRQQTQ